MPLKTLPKTTVGQGGLWLEEAPWPFRDGAIRASARDEIFLVVSLRCAAHFRRHPLPIREVPHVVLTNSPAMKRATSR